MHWYSAWLTPSCNRDAWPWGQVHLAWNVEGSPPLTVRFDRPHSPATLASAALGDGLWLVHADRPADAGLGEGVAWSTGDGRAGRALFLTPDAVRAAVAAMQRGQDAWKLAAA